jgi:methionine synthase I (cobalamin-dependent)
VARRHRNDLPQLLQQPAPTQSRRNTFGCNLVNLDNYDIADKIRELALKGSAIAKRVGSSWASRRRVTT